MVTSLRRSAATDTFRQLADAFLVTKLVNVRYLTGFTGSNGALLIRADGSAVLATDGRYAEQARAQAPDVDLLATRRPGPQLVALSTRASARRVAFERQHLTLTAYDALLAAAGDGVDLVGTIGCVESLRSRKDDAELRSIRAACETTDRAFELATARLVPGVTERQVAWQLLEAMHALGAETAAFDSIVAFGPHSAMPHHQPTDRALERGDLVKLDFGAMVAGYHADMTRTVVCGRAADWQRELHAAVLDVQQSCRDKAVAGAVPVQLDAVAQELVAQHGAGLVHGLGHGVGLEIHEAPFLVPGSTDAALTTGCTVTIEPGIYLPGKGGVRVEDTVLVTVDGPEPLTRSTRELLEV